MMTKPTKLQFAFAALAIALFFGLGVWDNARLKNEKKPHFTFEWIAGNPGQSSGRSLIYDARVLIPMVHVSSADPSGPHGHQRIGKEVDVRFNWNYWTLGLASLFAFFVPKMYERLPSAEISRKVKP